MSIYLNTIKTIGTLEIKERYGKDFRRIRRIQSRDPISCRFVVYRGDICLQEFRRKLDAIRWSESYGEGAKVNP